MMMQYKTKFGYKKFCSSEDIIWTKIDSTIHQIFRYNFKADGVGGENEQILDRVQS